ncbi:hypothetical protein RRG08_016317 [Elysia crispata]|uniref:Uncharacterized protein n=1 Tax=Elysia crispata TaxID=231223 RepID=A0AAE1E689_9GAST|nr:hypothetical protein RRG08_016317 [Elysia crispata]
MLFLAIALKKSPKCQSKAASSKADDSISAEVIETMILFLLIFVTCNIQLATLSSLRLISPTISSAVQYHSDSRLVDM